MESSWQLRNNGWLFKLYSFAWYIYYSLLCLENNDILSNLFAKKVHARKNKHETILESYSVCQHNTFS